jgi:hypothetical protein
MTFKVGQLPGYEPDPRAIEAGDFLRAYTGSFPFLLDLKRRLDEPWFTMSTGQIDAILRCKEREEGSKTKRGSGVDLSTLPRGTRYYAVDNKSGSVTFLRIDHVAEEESNPWNGWLFVKHIVGGGRSIETSGEKIGKQRPSDTYEGLWPELLAKVVHDPQEAMRRFGIEIGRCGVCGKVLTDPESRKFGIGPICRGGWGSL